MKSIKLTGNIAAYSTKAILEFCPSDGTSLIIQNSKASCDQLAKDIENGLVTTLAFSGYYDMLAEKSVCQDFALEDLHIIKPAKKSGGVFGCRYLHEINSASIKHGVILFSFAETSEWIKNLLKSFNEGKNTGKKTEEIININLCSSKEMDIPSLGKIQIVPSFTSKQSKSKLDIDYRFVLTLEQPRPSEDIEKVVVAVQSLISLGLDKPVCVDYIKSAHPKHTGRKNRLYFKTQNTDRNITADDTSRQYYFRYEDIGGILGVRNWILRMMLSQKHGWNDEVIASLLIQDTANTPYMSEHSIMPVITAALTLSLSEYRSNNTRRLQSLLLQLSGLIPTGYLNIQWCADIAYVRNQFIIHPENRRGEEFPEEEAFLAAQILKRICMSVVVKKMLGLSPKKAENLIKKIWKNRRAQKLLEETSTNDIKAWRDKNRNIKKDAIHKEKRQAVFAKAALPPDISTLPKVILKKEDKPHPPIYLHKCPKCSMLWRAVKQKKGSYNMHQKGKYNSPDTLVWLHTGKAETLKEANEKTREQVAKHFCLPV